ncbi:Adenosine/AMP deaminase [uncultured Desulfatiglans sp.]|uniref:adenosine deaminase n=1 Tax=Uncultured Desulfatiglans sp. TaxID=1748965 RepID=A0A653A9H6_UNCDX|nr:Adenosine/AMP deaminase [uncultured Desulfatiglans sp.]
MSDILVTTLGTSWQIVPELLGFTNPNLVDLYARHPKRDEIAETRRSADIRPVEEVWMVTTKGEKTDTPIQNLLAWHRLFGGGGRLPVLRIWQVAGAGDLASEEECRQMGECIFRVVLHAAERCADGHLLISLAGGRKTMSSDIQNAAVFFGCHALIHVIQNDDYAKKLWGQEAAFFLEPLPEDLKDAVTPLVAGRHERNPAADLGDESGRVISRDRYPLEMPAASEPLETAVAGAGLMEEVQERSRRASFLFCNQANRLMGEETGTNFLALYNLRPSLVRRLKTQRIGVDPAREDDELVWLQRLPKAELHCHLGGVADPAEILEIAEANRLALERCRDRWGPYVKEWRRLAEGEAGEGIDFKVLRQAVPGVPEPLCTAAFVLAFEDRADLLEQIIYGTFRHEDAFCGVGFKAYEKAGDLQGSGLLQSEASLRAACRILCRKAAKHNVRHLEVRCSPMNYGKGGLDPAEVVRVIDAELAAEGGPASYALIFTASRHGIMSKVYENIELAERLLGGDGSGFRSLRGFDLAGSEEAARPEQMREAFMPMMRRCLRLTIHAGETSSAESIWEAVYHLNAERIGHGLTLKENPVLLDKFRDRDIAIEMCPSSNVQIVGFRDNFLQATRRREPYPLKEYLERGLRVTVNTDNPGISRTDFTRELHRAARLTEGGLTLWEILLLVRNGFKASFAPRGRRQELLREAEKEIIQLIQERLQ